MLWDKLSLIIFFGEIVLFVVILRFDVVFLWLYMFGIFFNCN